MDKNDSGSGQEYGAGSPRLVLGLDVNSSQLIGGSLVAGLVLVLLFVLFNRRKLAKAKGNSLVLAGAPDSGKTALLSALVHGTSLPTLTSIQPNSSLIQLTTEPPKSIRVIDIPGHPRIRNQFKEYLNDASVVGFVVDASTVSRNGAIVAEHLHTIMHEITSLPPSHALPTLLIVAHKTDLLNTSDPAQASSVAITRVKSVLERELSKRRAATQSGVGIEGLGEDGGEKSAELGGLETTGPKGDQFKFDFWEGGEVAWIASSAKAKKEDIVFAGHEETKGENKKDSGVQAFRDWIEGNM